MTRPDFLVVGAPRAGTTALHYCLGQHPGISMSAVKEPNFFLFDGPGDADRPLVDDRAIVAKSVSDPLEYDRLFAAATPDDRTGEVSVLYLYTAETPGLIAASRPDARIVMVLRHPVERAYSHFLFTSTLPADQVRSAFREACEQEIGLPETPFRSGTHLLRLGDYGPQLDRYLEHFPRRQVHIGLYDDLVRDPDRFLRELCQFLEVDPDAPLQLDVNYNGSSVDSTARRALGQLAGRVAPTIKRSLPVSVASRLGRARARLRRQGEPPPLGAAFRTQLATHFEPSIRRVEELTGRDLARWRT